MLHRFDVLEGREMNDGEKAVRERVCAIVSAMAPDPRGTVADETDLKDELEYDSLRLMELAMALELRFALPPIDIESTIQVATVGDVVRLVTEALAEP
jgi:acyl carrier protein